MRRVALTGILTASSGFAREPIHSPLELRSPVQDKNFYLLSLIERDSNVVEALGEMRPLTDVLKQKRSALEKAAKSCATVPCLDEHLRWSDAEIAAIRATLKQAYSTSAAVRRLVDDKLRRSGVYIRYESKSGEELLAQAWTDTAWAMNGAIAVYGEGKEASRYFKMDPPAFDLTTAEAAMSTSS